MQSRGGRFDLWRRIGRSVALILAGTIVVILVVMAPDLQRFLPFELRRRRTGLALVVLAIAFAVGRICTKSRQADRESARLFPRVLDWLDRQAAGALEGGLTWVVVACSVGFLATWVPHYLFWPWYRDSDTFAILAQSWDAGILPYRDIRGYNFPGAIYLFWCSGMWPVGVKPGPFTPWTLHC